VHAASFLRERRIVLESELLARPPDLRLILTHELFHFVWWRLGNGKRRDFHNLLIAESSAQARAELGESSSVAKSSLLADDRDAQNARWKNYVCESFCDTAAWLYSGISTHPQFRLAQRWKWRRQAWFAGITSWQT
jgi:hypothetical protein